MNENALIAGLVAALIASAGLWWFRLILPVVRKQPKTTRYGVYAIVWLAYFILTMVVIGQSGA
ncbi:MAG: hypothetical protein CMI63_18965 [Parvularcula sp.]|uniref:hypothetical protein n=1 Tax=Hyphococcus sp. TaxID=2038636 RepID=UPI000C36F58F|nr:hypothetical protein [Parvularcula sp.]